MPLTILPNDALSDISRTPISARAFAASPFTGTQQVQDWGGEWWEYDLEFWAQVGAPGRALSAFFTSVGKGGQFIFRDPG